MRVLASRARVVAALVLALTLALTLAACGGGEDAEPADAPASGSPSSAAPTPDVEVPDGVRLTDPGSELGFGETATVAYEAGAQRGTVLGLTVLGVRTGQVRDLSAFQLDAATRASTPYYVRVQVTNEGTTDLGGAGVPLFAVDGRDVLIQPSSFTTGFERCPSTPLPERFGPGEEATRCLVYLVPEAGEELAAISYRPLQTFDPITWTGQVRPARGGGG